MQWASTDRPSPLAAWEQVVAAQSPGPVDQLGHSTCPSSVLAALGVLTLRGALAWWGHRGETGLDCGAAWEFSVVGRGRGLDMALVCRALCARLHGVERRTQPPCNEAVKALQF